MVTELLPDMGDSDNFRAGTVVSHRNFDKPPKKHLKLEDFEFKLKLGSGAYGKVYLAELTQDDGESKLYAIK